MRHLHVHCQGAPSVPGLVGRPRYASTPGPPEDPPLSTHAYASEGGYRCTTTSKTAPHSSLGHAPLFAWQPGSPPLSCRCCPIDPYIFHTLVPPISSNLCGTCEQRIDTSNSQKSYMYVTAALTMMSEFQNFLPIASRSISHLLLQSWPDAAHHGHLRIRSSLTQMHLLIS